MAKPRIRATARLAATIILVVSTIGVAWADKPGKRLAGTPGIPESTADIMARQAVSPPRGPRPDHELEYPDRSGLPQHPNALAVSSFPPVEPGKALAPESTKIHPRAPRSMARRSPTPTPSLPTRWARSGRRSSSPSSTAVSARSPRRGSPTG